MMNQDGNGKQQFWSASRHYMEFKAEINTCYPMTHMPHFSHHLSNNITIVF